MGARSNGINFEDHERENIRRPSVLRRYRGTTRWWRLEDRSRWRLATSDVGVAVVHEVLGSPALESPVNCHSELSALLQPAHSVCISLRVFHH